MNKKGKTFIILVCTMLLLSCSLGFFKENPKETIKRELELDASDGTVLKHMDNHGGFLGDGCSFISIRMKDRTVLKAIQGREEWKQLPLDETMKTLVDYIQDDDGNPLIPEFRNGYFILMDWQDETDTPILERYSLNYTVGLYDSDEDILYYGRFDT